jgi:hypothetical protein
LTKGEVKVGAKERIFGTNKPEVTEIEEFLLAEGFKYDDGPYGNGDMEFVACGTAYDGWVTLHKNDNYLDVYIEFSCGGHVNDAKFTYDPDRFETFEEAYEDAIDFVKRAIA